MIFNLFHTSTFKKPAKSKLYSPNDSGFVSSTEISIDIESTSLTSDDADSCVPSSNPSGSSRIFSFSSFPHWLLQMKSHYFFTVSFWKLVTTCLCWYSFSAINGNLKKKILVDYPFPLTFLFIQTVFTCCISGYPYRFSSFTTSYTSLLANENAFPWRSLLGLSFLHISASACSTLALKQSSVALIHTLKSLSPIFTWILYTYVWRQPAPSHAGYAFLPLTLGVILTCHFDPHSTFVGIFLALISILLHCTHALVCKPMSQVVSISTLLFFTSSVSATVFLPWVYWEHPMWPNCMVAFTMFIGCLTHLGQVSFAYRVLQRLDPLSFPIATLWKRLCVILVSMVWFQLPLSGLHITGMALALLGSYMYAMGQKKGEYSSESRK
ncbi:suppressor of loss of ypt1 [Coelomomyces lativittatus]|nr:suppressor of loss of ypt1 [Coelomomyces lativittatus]KAJ1512076.1 suppressor of loss of ypt1 [Coelomomyces lativittatus]KAJ1513242.1 suppressor of loss of ypt1 [Coelomomyces lativittatus]